MEKIIYKKDKNEALEGNMRSLQETNEALLKKLCAIEEIILEAEVSERNVIKDIRRILNGEGND